MSNLASTSAKSGACLHVPAHPVNTLVSEKVKVATDTDWKTITEAGLEAITQETLKQL